MHPELEKILNEVINNAPGAYLRFRQKQIQLKGGCNYFQFVEFMSQQPSLISCDPEALLDLGFIAVNNHWFFMIPPELQLLLGEPINNINISMLYAQLKNAATTNLGALGAILELLEVKNTDKVFDDIQKDARNEFIIMTTQLDEMRRTCPAHQKKFLHYVDGLIFSSKLSNAKDIVSAKEKFEAAAELGLAMAHIKCGEIYEKGHEKEIEQDLSQALYHYESAEKQHHAHGCFNFGWMLESGQGIKKRNKFKAIQCFLTSGYLGHPEAQYHFAQRNDTDKTIHKRDIQNIFFWYEQAIRQNYSDAQFCKGWLLQNEQNGPVNLLLAAKLFLMAAKQNDFTKIAQGALSYLLVNPDFHPDQNLRDEITQLLTYQENDDVRKEDIKRKCDLAKHLIEVEYLNDAIEILSKIIQQDPENTGAYLQRAKAERTLCNRAKALADLEKIIKLNPQSVDALKELIGIYDEIKKYQEVIKYCTKLLKIDEEKYYKYNHFCASAYVAKGDLRTAVNYYNEYIKYNTTNPDVYRDRAFVNENLGFRKLAAEDRKSEMILRTGGVIQPLPLITQQIPLENDLIDMLNTYLNDLYIIRQNAQNNDIIILQLKPINEIVELLTNRVKQTLKLTQFTINNQANLNKLILEITHRTLQKSYKDVVIRDMKIEIQASSAIHKTNGYKSNNDLINLIEIIVKTLPEYQAHIEMITIKESCKDNLQKIKNFEKKYTDELEQINAYLKKQQNTIDLIKVYNGDQPQIRQLIKRLNAIYNLFRQFVDMTNAAIKQPKYEELTRTFQEMCSKQETLTNEDYQKFLRQLDNKMNAYKKIPGFNKKTKFAELMECINEYNQLITQSKSNLTEKIVEHHEPPAPAVLETDDQNEDDWHIVKNKDSLSPPVRNYVKPKKTFRKKQPIFLSRPSHTTIVKENKDIKSTDPAPPKKNGTTSHFENPHVLFKTERGTDSHSDARKDITAFLSSGEIIEPRISSHTKTIPPIGSERSNNRPSQT